MTTPAQLTTPAPLSAPSEERGELAATVRRFFARRCDETWVRTWMEMGAGFDPLPHRELAEQIGVFSLAVPEEYGGAGFGFADLLPVFEEAGRALYGGPLLSTATATAALLAGGDKEACSRWLPGIAEGRTVAALAWLDEGGWEEAAVRSTAHRGPDGWTVSGAKRAVVDGAEADLLLVPARTPGGVRLFAVAADAPGLTRSPLHTIDMTRRQADLALDAVPAEPAGGWEAVERAVEYAALAVAAEASGAARLCLDQAVGYAATRRQFSRPIGSFQAVKHRLADLWTATEAAAVVLRQAAAQVDRTGAPVALDTWHALLACLDAVDACSEGSIRVHGGIGFTWEHPAHLYFRRSRSLQTLLGPRSAHRERLAALAGLPPLPRPEAVR